MNAVITAWRLVDSLGCNPYDRDAVRAEAMIDGRRAGSIVRHGQPFRYIANTLEYTLGTFGTLAQARAAIDAHHAAQVQPEQIADEPLLIVACSATKRETTTPQPITEVYDGPMWKQIRKAGIDAGRVAALSAEHGFLPPHSQITTYDRAMTADRVAQLAQDDGAQLATTLERHGRALVFGGELYRSLVARLLRSRPDLVAKLTFATGSFLKQRAQLSAALAGQITPTTADLFTA